MSKIEHETVQFVIDYVNKSIIKFEPTGIINIVIINSKRENHLYYGYTVK